MIKLLRHLLVDDFLLKLFSFVLALLFWFTVSFAIRQGERPAVPALSLTPDVRKDFRLAVQAFGPVPDARKLEFSPAEVIVTLQGDARLMQDLQTRDVRAMADLATADLVRNPTNRVRIAVPAGVTVFRVMPPEVQVIVAPRD